MRRFYVWDRIDEEWAEVDRSVAPPPRMQIISEITPYRSPMGDGVMIETRRQRDEHLKAHGCAIADPVMRGALVNPKNAGKTGYDPERSREYYQERARNAGERAEQHADPHDGGR
jgi:hypothetical protein